MVAWELHLARYAFVKAFVHRIKGLEGLDAALQYMGKSSHEFELAEIDEYVVRLPINDHQRPPAKESRPSITIKVVSTFLLLELRSSAQKFHTTPRISIVRSSVHNLVELPAKADPEMFNALNDRNSAVAKLSTRYIDGKPLEILCSRGLASALASALSSSRKPVVILSLLNPGFCASASFQNPSTAFKLQVKALGRTAEEDSRALVDAVASGKDSHGQHLSDSGIAKVSDFVLSRKGWETQERVWDGLNASLEKTRVLDDV